MDRSSRALGLALGAMCLGNLFSLCVYADETAPAKSGDKAAIEALEQRFAAAFNAKDVGAIMQVYAPGTELFVFDVTPPRQHLGWDDYKKDWQELFAASPGPVKFSISALAITTVGPVAYGHSIQSAQFGHPDGSQTELVVRVTDVYRKIHGHWLIVQEHVSVPVDLASGKADLLSKP
jgi:ketosteroid isomerase-like protein